MKNHLGEKEHSVISDPEKNGGYQVLIVDTPLEKERPVLISAMCLLGFFHTLFAIAVILFAPQSVEKLVAIYGHHLPMWSVVINIFSLIAFVGIWRMRYWGMILYIVAYIAGAFHAHMTGYELLWAYLPGFLVIVISLIYLRRFVD